MSPVCLPEHKLVLEAVVTNRFKITEKASKYMYKALPK